MMLMASTRITASREVAKRELIEQNHVNLNILHAINRISDNFLVIVLRLLPVRRQISSTV